MKAARVIEGKLEIQDLPNPEPLREQALIKISATGVCHSDLHLMRGDWMGVQSDVIGHEAIGEVEALGPGAEQFISIGDRVILGLGGASGNYWCGACEYCLQGDPRHCNQNQVIMGTFAEKFCVWAKSLVKIPDNISDKEAPLACGGLTAYSSIKKLQKHNIKPGSTVALIGAAGGLGHYAVQLAKACGYKVVGIDIGEERLEFVKSLGADLAVDPQSALEEVQRNHLGVDASIVFSAKMTGFNLGMQLLKPKGLFVAVALPATSEGNLQLNPFEFFYKDITLIYSAPGNVQDMRELVEIASDGKVQSHIGRVGALSELGNIFDELENGKYVGRAVITDLKN